MSATIKWGLITGMVYVIFSLISNMLGLQQGGSGGSMGIGMLMNVLMMGATFGTIFMGVREFRDQENGGFLTMGEGFMSGLKIALIAGVIAGLFTLLYMTVIDPDMTDKILESAEEQMDKSNVPEEQREMSRKITGMFLNPVVMAPFMIIWIALWGMGKALIAGAILKKEAPPTMPAE
jgi:hypothetical protein